MNSVVDLSSEEDSCEESIGAIEGGAVSAFEIGKTAT